MASNLIHLFRRYISTKSKPPIMAHVDKPDLPAFPRQQMFVLALCRICEPIAFMSIFPYIYFMVRDFQITDDTSRISFYAGMVTSAFTFAEFSTGFLWGKLSDRIGRKPVLLMGLAGTALSVLIFGLSPSLPVALVARAIGGFLNGNMGVLQTAVAELVPCKAQQRQLARYCLSNAWLTVLQRSIIGPAIGGALARPCDHFPDLFPLDSIFAKFPYLLPNLFSATVVAFSLTVGVLFLEETHSEFKHRRDPGLELGSQLTSWVTSCMVSLTLPSTSARLVAGIPLEEAKRTAGMPRNHDEIEPLLEVREQDDDLPGYESMTSTNNNNSTGNTQTFDEERGLSLEAQQPGTSVTKSFSKPIVLIISSFGILAFHTMTFDALLPVLFSTARRRDPFYSAAVSAVVNPTVLSTVSIGKGFSIPLPRFKFANGFGMSSSEIGVIMAVQGFYSILCNMFVFPTLCRRFSAIAIFRFLACTYFLLYTVTPFLVLLPDASPLETLVGSSASDGNGHDLSSSSSNTSMIQLVGIYAIIVWKCTYATLAYPSNGLLLNTFAMRTVSTQGGPELSPSSSLGAINGVAASTASLCRALGPLVSGALYAVGLQAGWSGFVWWVTALVTLVGAAVALAIPALDDEDDDRMLDHEEVANEIMVPVDSEAVERPN